MHLIGTHNRSISTYFCAVFLQDLSSSRGSAHIKEYVIKGSRLKCLHQAWQQGSGYLIYMQANAGQMQSAQVKAKMSPILPATDLGKPGQDEFL